MKVSFTYASEFDNKWRVCFAISRPRKGVEIMSELCSALIFDTESEATAAGHRAVEIFNKTKKMPDLTELF